ncbi:hypothetical protein [Streptomyces virginiae]
MQLNANQPAVLDVLPAEGGADGAAGAAARPHVTAPATTGA